jgi:hypothetical protein
VTESIDAKVSIDSVCVEVVFVGVDTGAKYELADVKLG